MPGQNDPGNKQNQVPESEKGFEQVRDKQGPGTGQAGSQQDRGSTGTGTGTATSTAPQNPVTAEQDPGTSRQNQSTTDAPIRNPSGDDLSQGIEGDEGSGRGI
jgi:hypothetical protein